MLRLRGRRVRLLAVVALTAVLATASPVGAASAPAANACGTVTVQNVTLFADTPYPTVMTVIRSSNSGPQVMVVGGLHGGQPAGVEAARSIAGIRPARGTLLVIPELNPVAVRTGVRTPSGHEDLNRVFPKAAGDAPASARARELWQVLRDYGVDYLFDLHEGRAPQAVSSSIGQSVIVANDADDISLAREIVRALNASETRSAYRWAVLKPAVLGGLVRAASDHLNIESFFVTTTASDPLQRRVAAHRLAVETLLRREGMLADGCAPASGPAPQPAPQPQPQPQPAPEPRPGGSVRTETLMAGTRYETKLYVIDSGVPGPTVWISGGVHGSELAGWQAAEQVARWRVGRGRLIVLPHANQPAIQQRRRYASGDTDLNRAFPIRGSDSTPDTALARAIWDAVRRHRPDVLIDLHEALYNHNTNSSSTGQTLIAMPATVSLGQQVFTRLNREERISSTWRFTVIRYPVKGSLARAAGDVLGIRSGIFETSRQLPLSTRIRYQLRFVEILLQKLGLQPVVQTSSLQSDAVALASAGTGRLPASRYAA